MKQESQVVLVARARNEGVYLLEWIQHHLAIGFDHIVLVTNDLSDSSEELIRILCSNTDRITWLDCSLVPLGGDKVSSRSLNFVRANFDFLRFDWLMVLDMDEFLLIEGGGTVSKWLEGFESADQVVVYWRNFGPSGEIEASLDVGVLERFRTFQPIVENGHEFKTLTRTRYLGRLSDHFATVEKERVVVLRADGQCLFSGPGGSQAVENIYRKSNLPSWSGAWVSHFRTKSAQEFVSRGYRGYAGSTAIQTNLRYGPRYFLKYQRDSVLVLDCPKESDEESWIESYMGSPAAHLCERAHNALISNWRAQHYALPTFGLRVEVLRSLLHSDTNREEIAQDIRSVPSFQEDFFLREALELLEP